MNPNLIFLNSFLDVSEETFSKLTGIATYKKLRAGELIARPGEIPSKIYMLTTGMMRAYLSTENGKEFNKNFFMPFSFVGALTALIQNQPSKLTYEALTECSVYEVNFHDIEQLCKEDITISNLYNRILEHVYIRYEERQLELISLDAKDRYLALRKKIPKIDELIPQYQIASYLSITPVQLSRIRRKIKKDDKKGK
ncbi:Crp/Fnr family transcriptional regulator [uncultured Algibacter sp.]|uniref:Crp/Fnr family transcriptional regulator n=1 Tax=uncultured Algibacter sp. TaxID=298659 RepID=UPI002623B798|nr:Crp/Fnr family transcriptional regulator [uncultured Algibacter sp.]